MTRRDSLMSESSDPPAGFGIDDGIIIPKLIQFEGERSFEEANALRTAVYARIRQHIQMDDVIDAVEAWRPRTPITLTDGDGRCVDLNDVPDGQSVYATVQVQKFDKEEVKDELARFGAKVKETSTPQHPFTAGELLAHALRLHLAALRAAERRLRRGESSESPVRQSKMLPRSVLAEVADDLLQDCETWGYPPGPELTALIRELLGVHRTRKDADQEYRAKHDAAWILAQMDVGVRKLAGMVGVKPSTVSEWRKDPTFVEWVERNRRTIERWRRGEFGFGAPLE